MSEVKRNKWAEAMRKMVRDYREEGWPIVNGSFKYSNLLEGPTQILTCNPYRLWEYASLFLLEPSWNSDTAFLDIGGAGSLLPYFLAESGYDVHTIDLQPLLVQMCNQIALHRKLPLTASTSDITGCTEFDEKFDMVVCISVLEHIPEHLRARFLQSACRVLKPGGVLYLTFDYGSYVEPTEYHHNTPEVDLPNSVSIDSINSLCDVLEASHMEFIGNDPRTLPAQVLEQKMAPRYRDVTYSFSMNTCGFDSQTPWREIGRYLLKRIFRYCRSRDSRFAQHNFFRMFLRKPV